MRRKRIVYYLLFIFLGTNLYASELKNGVINLSAQDLASGIVELKGEILFYHKAFISSTSQAKAVAQPQRILTSNSWNNQPKGYKNYKSISYGTYYFKINIPEEYVGASFMMRPKHFIAYASEVYVNGKICLKNGSVGFSREHPDYQPSRKTDGCAIIPDTTALDVYIQVANFHHFRGGIFKPIAFGLEKNMRYWREKSIAFDLLVIVSLLIMFFYHLIMYLVNTKQITSAYFALVCIVFATDLSFQGSMCFFLFFPEASFDFYAILHLINPYFIPATFMLFYGALFPTHVSKRLIRFSVLLSIIFALCTIFGSISLRSFIIKPNYIYSTFLIFYIIFTSYKLVKDKVFGAKLFAFSFIFFSVCALNDILNMFELIQTSNILTYGIIGFIILLSVLYGRQTSRLYFETISLTEDLKLLNNRLEDIVKQRTKKLNESLKDLNKLNKFQEGMTNLIAHDLKSPLMQILNIDTIREKDFPAVKNSGYRMLNMIQNMLDLYRFNNNRMVLNKQEVNVFKSINQVVEESSFFAHKKSIKVEVLHHYKCTLLADKELFKRIITNLLSNALRFSPNGGLITIKVNTTKDNHLRVTVSNQGPEIPSTVLNRLFSDKAIHQTSINDFQETSGIGLHLSKKAINAHGGDIGVRSEPGKNVEFWFELPGIVYSEKKSEKVLHDFDEPYTLSNEESKYLLPYVQQLAEFEIFQTTKLEELLQGIERKSTAIKRWLRAVEKACYNMDEEKLKELIQFVKKNNAKY